MASTPITAKQFSESMEKVLPGPLPNHIAVALSGGADSMALTLLAHTWAQEKGAMLTALTVDHKIRAESTEEAAKIKQWMRKYGIPLQILNADRILKNNNLQEKARLMRYDLLTSWCHANNVNHLLLAHHAQDQLETLLMRLVRAGGIEGLSAMRLQSKNNNINILRPLLNVSKEDLIATLQHKSQAWIEDPSNQKRDYTRVRLRPIAQALMEEGMTSERITQTTQQLASASDYFALEINNLIEKYVTLHPAGYVAMPMELWQQIHPELGWRLLKFLLIAVNGKDDFIRRETLMRVFKKLEQGTLIKAMTAHACHMVPRSKDKQLFIIQEPHKIEKKEIEKTVNWNHKFQVSLDVSIKCFIAPFKQAGLNQLPKAYRPDLPAAILKSFPAFFSLEELIAVPHMGYYKETSFKEAIHITCEWPKPLAVDEGSCMNRRDCQITVKE